LRSSAVIHSLLAVGVVVQLAMGEMGLLESRALRDIHATIGIAGVALALLALRAVRGRLAPLLYASALLILVVIQAGLGLALYGVIRVGGELHEVVEQAHRLNAYAILAAGLVGGIVVAVSGRLGKAVAEG